MNWNGEYSQCVFLSVRASVRPSHWWTTSKRQDVIIKLVTSFYFTQPPMRRMRICFTDVFFVFAFSVRRKNTRQPFSGTAERIFMKLLPNDSGENGVCIAIPKLGLGPPINFLGAKNYTLRTWWWRVASDWELVCWLWHCAATAVALKRHERVNAFNLVFFWRCYPDLIFWNSELTSYCGPSSNCVIQGTLKIAADADDDEQNQRSLLIVARQFNTPILLQVNASR